MTKHVGMKLLKLIVCFGGTKWKIPADSKAEIIFSDVDACWIPLKGAVGS